MSESTKPINIKIVTDSSCDIFDLDGVAFSSAPLKIITSEREFVDDRDLDTEEMVSYLHAHRGRSKTSCPNVADWLRAFGDAERIFCITITGTLSGSHNAAVVAKKEYEEMYPERQVFVMDSLSTGPEISLIVRRLREHILNGWDFDKICEDAVEYKKRTGLFFVLESMKNLANNGRVSPLIAKMAGLLGIRLVGRASESGDLEPIGKCRGEAKALETVVQQLKLAGFNGGKILITHCLNEKAGKALAELIKAEFAKAQVALEKCRGLCSFYAERGGLLVGFERA